MMLPTNDELTVMIRITCHTANDTKQHTFVDLAAAVYAFGDVLQNAYALKEQTHYKKVSLFPYTAASLVKNLNVALYNMSPNDVDTRYTLD